MCYDESYNAVLCLLISEEGCPCPEGQVRCNADLVNGCVGYCTADVCCDWTTEYVCHDSKVCAKYDGDGCPCADDQMECFPGAGVCSSICCDSTIDETCYGSDGYTVSSCAKVRLSPEIVFAHSLFSFLNAPDSERTTDCWWRLPVSGWTEKMWSRLVCLSAEENNIQPILSKVLFIVSQTQRSTMLVGVAWSVATAPLKKPALNLQAML